MKQGLWVLVFGLCAGCSGADDAEVSHAEHALASRDFDVDFSGCREFVGIGFVPKANAVPLVPAGYVLAGDDANAVIVVRVARCAGASVDGKPPKALGVAQVGITLAGPDTTADINNYTLWLGTDLGLLHAKLNGAGVEHEKLKDVDFRFARGRLDIEIDPKRDPDYEVHGSATAPTTSPTLFTASWWTEGRHGTVRMRTVFPAIRFGTSNTTLTTPAGSAFATLIGGTSLGFPILDSYNTFPSAHMDVENLD